MDFILVCQIIRIKYFGSITQKNVIHRDSFQFQLISEYWSNGMLECWSNDLMNDIPFFNTPILHHSGTPSLIHTVGDIKIYPVVYSSFANEFFAVYFQNDVIISSQLRNYFNEKYGSSKTTNRLNPRRTTNLWNHRDVEITLKLNRETGKLKLSFNYTPLSAKVDKIRLEAYQENTRSFLDRINTDRAEEFMDMMR